MIPFDENDLALFQKLVVEWNNCFPSFMGKQCMNFHELRNEIDLFFDEKFDFSSVVIYSNSISLYNPGNGSSFAKIDYDSEIRLTSSPKIRIYANEIYDPYFIFERSKRDRISNMNKKYDLDLPLKFKDWTMEHILMLKMIL